jgi:hypothetical protein
MLQEKLNQIMNIPNTNSKSGAGEGIRALDFNLGKVAEYEH